MATSDAIYDKHENETTIKMAYDGDEIMVWPSVEVPGHVAISLADSQEDRVNVGIASPAECDALIAAIGRALGRPAVSEKAADLAQAFAALPDETVEQMGRNVRAWRTGSGTVLLSVLLPILTLHAQIAEESGEGRADAIEALLTALDEARATLAAAGLWPLPATTPKEGA